MNLTWSYLTDLNKIAADDNDIIEKPGFQNWIAFRYCLKDHK